MQNEQNRTEQNRTEQNRTEQNRTEQNRTEQSNRIDPLNGLRVLALFLTFVSHTYLFDGRVFEAGKLSAIFAAPAWACMWVLFPLSGYLAGRSFALGKYQLTAAGVKKYYVGRVLKIWLPTVLFIFLTALLSYPDFLFSNSPSLILRCLTCQQVGGPDGIGATWFVFNIMWMYLLTPMLCRAAQRLTQRSRLVVIVLVAAAGLGYRLLTWHFGLDYMSYVYNPPICDLDLYTAGVLVAYSRVSTGERNRGGAAIPLCLCYLGAYYAVYQAVANGKGYLYNTVYSYLGPTAFLIATLLFTYTADDLKNTAPVPATIADIANNPLRGTINWFAGIGFEFYLFHSLILNRISPYISDTFPIQQHLKLLSAAFFFSTVLAYGFHLFSTELQKKLENLCYR